MQQNKYLMHDLRRFIDAVSPLCEAQLLEVELPDTVFRRAAQQMVGAIDWGGGEGEGVAQDLGYDWDTFDLSRRTVKAKLKKWALDRVYSAYEEIEYEFRTGTLPIYRVITAPPDWKPDPNRHPGVYWSWDEDAAEAHHGQFGSGHVKWLLTGAATPDMIDWENTLRANAQPDMANEREITLKDDVPVQFTYRQVGAA